MLTKNQLQQHVFPCKLKILHKRDKFYDRHSFDKIAIVSRRNPFVDNRVKLKYVIPMERSHDDRHNSSLGGGGLARMNYSKNFPSRKNTPPPRTRGLSRRGFYTIPSVFVLHRTRPRPAVVFICSRCRVTRSCSRAKSATYLYSFVYSARTYTVALAYAG